MARLTCKEFFKELFYDSIVTSANISAATMARVTIANTYCTDKDNKGSVTDFVTRHNVMPGYDLEMTARAVDLPKLPYAVVSGVRQQLQKGIDRIHHWATGNTILAEAKKSSWFTGIAKGIISAVFAIPETVCFLISKAWTPTTKSLHWDLKKYAPEKSSRRILLPSSTQPKLKASNTSSISRAKYIATTKKSSTSDTIFLSRSNSNSPRSFGDINNVSPTSVRASDIKSVQGTDLPPTQVSIPPKPAEINLVTIHYKRPAVDTNTVRIHLNKNCLFGVKKPAGSVATSGFVRPIEVDDVKLTF